jgi:hypothetical protein
MEPNRQERLYNVSAMLATKRLEWQAVSTDVELPNSKESIVEKLKKSHLSGSHKVFQLLVNYDSTDSEQ